MEMVSLANGPEYDTERFVAESFLEGARCNVRVIRLSPGQALPPHVHGASELMLYVVEGDAVLTTTDGTVAFGAGSLAYYRGDEELRVANAAATGLTLLAFLAPAFPPRSTD